MDLHQLYDQYERTNRTARSPHTRKLNRLAFRQFLQALQAQQNGAVVTAASLSDDSLALLESMLLDTKRLSLHTVNRTVSRVKSFWAWCARRGHVRDWPTARPLPAPEPFRKAWTADQVRQLLEGCHHMQGDYAGVPASLWWRVWHCVQWETGERTGAMLRLEWDWLAGTVLSVPAMARKACKAATYRLSAQCMLELDAIRQPARALVFPWTMTSHSFYYHYTRLLKLAGLPTDRKCKPQRMRRSHLTYWAVAGLDASARAQHSSPAITQRHYLDETLLPQVDPSTVLPSILTPPGTDEEVQRG